MFKNHCCSINMLFSATSISTILRKHGRQQKGNHKLQDICDFIPANLSISDVTGISELQPLDGSVLAGCDNSSLEARVSRSRRCFRAFLSQNMTVHQVHDASCSFSSFQHLQHLEFAGDRYYIRSALPFGSPVNTNFYLLRMVRRLG